MKFSFKNLGPINHGELELSKLTILCGKNNTGKTYLTYTIYGFLRNWKSLMELQVREFLKLGNVEPVEIDLSRYAGQSEQLLKTAIDKYVIRLHVVLGGTEARFQDTQLGISLPALDNLLDLEYSQTLTLAGRRSYVQIEKRMGEYLLNVSFASDFNSRASRAAIHRIISDEIIGIIFQKLFPRVFIVSTERTGAVTFRNELNLTKNRLIDAAQTIKADDTKNAAQIWEMLQSSAYPLPVRDNVDFLNTVTNITGGHSFIAEEHPNLLNDFSDLIGGDFRVDRQGNELNFMPQSVRGVRLRMSESSSAVRSLVMLGLYLRHVAAKDDLLMIDEPELNLHPSNQRILARLIARLSNIGLRVFITTHSDYIVRELNNLIILRGLGERATSIMKRHGYHDNELIDCDGFRLYTLESGKFKGPGDMRTPRTVRVRLSKAVVSQRDGLEETSFDETIAKMNEVFTELVAANE